MDISLHVYNIYPHFLLTCNRLATFLYPSTIN
nr:MAG TPA: hypothetical protein [Caudoviricetes sp.]